MNMQSIFTDLSTIAPVEPGTTIETAALGLKAGLDLALPSIIEELTLSEETGEKIVGILARISACGQDHVVVTQVKQIHAVLMQFERIFGPARAFLAKNSGCYLMNAFNADVQAVIKIALADAHPKLQFCDGCFYLRR